MELYAILRKGKKDFRAGLLSGELKIVEDTFRVDSLDWKPYKKICEPADIKKMIEKSDEHFMNLIDFCKSVFPKTKYDVDTVNVFIKNIQTFTNARQIWVHKKSII